MESRRRPAVRFVLLVVAIAAATIGGYLAGARLVADSEEPSDEPDVVVTVSATRGTLSEWYDVPIEASWPVAFGYALPGPPGVTTAMSLSNEEYRWLGDGDVLGHVDGKPVIAIAGDEPSYRTIERGDEGVDVLQLQQFLTREELLEPSNADGQFGRFTEQAVEELWARYGLEDRTDVPLGSAVFVPDLPRWLSAGPAVQVGRQISENEEFVVGIESQPELSVRLSAIQEQRFRQAGASFTVSTPDGTPLELQPTGDLVTVDGAAELRLRPVDRDPTSLGELSSPGQSTRITAVMTVIPETTGTIVPISALHNVGQSSPGRDAVSLASGEVTEVDVKAIVGGEAVVEGLDPGTSIRAVP